MGKSKKVVLIIIFILLIGIFGIEIYSKVYIGRGNENNVTSTDSYGSGEPPKVENTNVEEEVEENIEGANSKSDEVKDTEYKIPEEIESSATNIIRIDDKWQAFFIIYMEEDGKIYNIADELIYNGENDIYYGHKDSEDTCEIDDEAIECQSSKINTSLNNMSLYITCKGEFPEEHFDLTDEQYENVKKEYDSFVANPTVEYTGVSGKCISDKGY